uniref:Secreted protein n=1 Tax=Steinernema glaseri TaxID=37863 RepID=A0A1I7ZVS0_9BILA
MGKPLLELFHTLKATLWKCSITNKVGDILSSHCLDLSRAQYTIFGGRHSRTQALVIVTATVAGNRFRHTNTVMVAMTMTDL